VSGTISRLAEGCQDILVIGDLILDRYIWGEVERISPEAPVQVLKWEREEQVLGGAANVAHNLSTLGCPVRLMGLIGEDADADRFEELTRVAGIDTRYVTRIPGRPTVTKTRFIGRGQQILRLDREDDNPQPGELEGPLLANLTEAIEGAAGVICSDYLKGTLSPGLMSKVVDAAGRANISIITDPKGGNYSKYKGVTAITPNLSEVALATGMRLDTEEAIDSAAHSLFEQLGTQYILITRGAGGMTLFGKNGRLSNEPANALEVYDVTGAGDTAAALFSLALFQGESPVSAAEIANTGAGIVVGKVGTAPVSALEIESAMSSGGRNKILSREELGRHLEMERAKGRKVVFTNGCFDLLHVGHIQYLQQAKNLGDLLVIGLNDDASVRKLKGEGRPLIEEKQRAQLMSALECVDFIVFFSEDTPKKLLETLRPDILVKGGDYTPDEVVGRDLVESYGGRLEVLPFVDGVSTTSIVNTIIERYKQDNTPA
jgi:D-beta-D-heptose 7-phosphate kinase / D-beta-D-heptose 1-phosphate adenosyltransferase